MKYNNGMTEQNYPDFYKHVDDMNTLTAEQLDESRQLFDSLFDDVMLRHMGDVRVFGANTNSQHASLLKKIEINGQTYTLSLNDRGIRDPESSNEYRFRDSEKLQRIINLQRTDEQGYGREHWSYRLCEDGIIRRMDLGDTWGKMLKEKELGIEGPKNLSGDETPEEMAQAIQASLRNLTEGIPNSRLEEDMGINNQPVSPEELAGLKAFIDGAKVL